VNADNSKKCSDCSAPFSSSNPQHDLCYDCAGKRYRATKKAPKPVAKDAPKPAEKDAPKPAAKDAPKPADKEVLKPAEKQAPNFTRLSKKQQAAVNELFSKREWSEEREHKFISVVLSAKNRGVDGDVILAAIGNESVCMFGTACTWEKCTRSHPGDEQVEDSPPPQQQQQKANGPATKSGSSLAKTFAQMVETLRGLGEQLDADGFQPVVGPNAKRNNKRNGKKSNKKTNTADGDDGDGNADGDGGADKNTDTSGGDGNAAVGGGGQRGGSRGRRGGGN
jgi:hypothetical protein